MPAGPARPGVPPLPKVDSLFSERLAAGAARRLAPRCSARKPRTPAPFARRSLFSERLAAGAARRLAPRCSARKPRNPAPFARRLYVAHVRSSQHRGEMGQIPEEGRRAFAAEASSSEMRLAPSTGVQGSNGIQRRSAERPRMHKRERERRLRSSCVYPVPKGDTGMRFAGIDIASETHVVAIVDERGEVVCKATSFAEDAAGYDRFVALL